MVTQNKETETVKTPSLGGVREGRKIMSIKTFWLILSYGCNNRCQVCYADPSIFSNNTFMPLSCAQEVITEMKNIGGVKGLLIGGEPTLHPNLFEIISFMKEKQIASTLITNGRKLSDVVFVRALEQSGVSKVVISLQGSNASVHNNITHSSKSFQETIEGIINCQESSVNFCVLTTIQDGNKDDCINIPKFLQSIGVNRSSFNCGIPCLTKKGVIYEHVMHPLDIALVIESIYNRYSSSESNTKVDFNTTIPLCAFSSEKVIQKMLSDGVIAVGCQMYYGKGIAFDPIGNILPCTHFADFPLLKETFKGNRFTLKNRMQNIWDNDNTINIFREKLWRYPVSECKECNYWGACIGGCPLFWTHFNPEFLKRKEVSNSGSSVSYRHA